MSLISEAKKPCSLLTRFDIADGRGSRVERWEASLTFEAAFVLSASGGVSTDDLKKTDKYIILTDKSVQLRYHDIVRRESDGKIFRVCTKGDVAETPDSAGLNIRQVAAEEWHLPEV